jgi:hypothetical protein
MAAMSQTLENPDIIIQDSPDKWYFVKTFKKTTKAGFKTLLDVGVKKGDFKYSISIHQKSLNNILNKIKKAGDIIYPGRIKTSGANHSLFLLSPDSGKKSSDCR